MMNYQPGQRVQVLIDRYLLGKGKGVWAQGRVEGIGPGGKPNIVVKLDSPVHICNLVIEGTISVISDEIIP